MTLDLGFAGLIKDMDDLVVVNHQVIGTGSSIEHPSQDDPR